jgi:hypothetical protein
VPSDLPTHVTLTAATVATVVLNGTLQSVDVWNQSSSAVAYVRADGVNPTVAGDFCQPVMPIGSAYRCHVRAPIDVSGNTVTLKFISSATPTLSIVPCTCTDLS